MYLFDAEKLGQYGVEVLDITKMSEAAITGVVNGEGTIIGGFCNSGACLAPYIR
jgi:hypothetical protein